MWKGWQLRSQLECADRPLHHRGPPAFVGIDGDGGAPEAELAVGAEVAVEVVAQADVSRVVDHPEGPPHEGALVVPAVVALDGAVAAVAGLRLGGRDREVAAVGGALEEEQGGPVDVDAVHPPHRVQGEGGAVRAQGDPLPVVVGVEVRLLHAVPQPHEGPVGKEVHRRDGRQLLTTGAAQHFRRGLGARGERREQSRCSLGRDGYVWVWAPRRGGGGGVFEVEGVASGVWDSRAQVGCARASFHRHVGPLLGPDTRRPDGASLQSPAGEYTMAATAIGRGAWAIGESETHRGVQIFFV